MKTKQHATKTPMDEWKNHKRNQKIPWDKWKQKHNFPNLQTLQNLGLPQETRKISNKQPNLPSKRIKKEQTKPKVRRKK